MAIVYESVTMPVFTPETTPVVDPIVAIVLSLLLQMPPATAVSVLVCPWHTLAAPVIADTVLTVTVVIARQLPTV